MTATAPPTSRKRKKTFAEYKSKELVLPMGRPNNCFENAMALVIAHPKRLRYVEGFYLGGDNATFVHHGWVKDVKTGKRHEVTIQDVDPDAVYIGKEFTMDELTAESGDTIDFDYMWETQLTMQEQYDMLTTAGYDVDLCAGEWDKTEFTYRAEVDLSTIDMTLRWDSANHALTNEHGDGWEYQWYEATPETGAMAAGAAA